MALIWWLTFHLYMISLIDPVQAVDLSKASFVSAESGGEVTLHCKNLEKFAQSIKVWVWYKQRTGQEPQEVAAKLSTREAPTSVKRHKISQIFNLTIEQTTKADEGMYFCGKGDGNTVTFTNGVFLAVTEDPVDPVMLTLAVFSAVCVAVICAQTILIHKLRKSEHGAGEKAQEEAMSERTTRQEQNTENLHYAAIHIKEKKAKGGRVKREQPEDVVYSHVRSSNAAAQRSHR
ncbi:hypothetical protein SRHO_G00125170 [Serrasalmus rhombeus]